MASDWRELAIIDKIEFDTPGDNSNMDMSEEARNWPELLD